MISISIVSHAQCELVGSLLDDLSAYAGMPQFEVLLTLNIPEVLPFAPGSSPFPVHVISNPSAQGFGANHNAAFRQASG